MFRVRDLSLSLGSIQCDQILQLEIESRRITKKYNCFTFDREKVLYGTAVVDGKVVKSGPRTEKGSVEKKKAAIFAKSCVWCVYQPELS